MRVLHINTIDLNGGAARAVNRLHHGLQAIKVDSLILVQTRQGKEPNVIAHPNKIMEGLATMRPSFEALPLKMYPKRKKTTFSPQWIPDRILSQISNFNPDLIHLHWVNQGFVQIETLAKLKCPVVWTLHDMWAFTGGCHYAEGCTQYTVSCGNCPQLMSSSNDDLSRWIWKRKAKSWKSLNLTIVAPSKWISTCAASSSLFQNKRIEIIPHGLNLEIYKPIDKSFARSLLNLPQASKIILFGAVHGTAEKRKGFHLLLPALQKLYQSSVCENIELAIIGQSAPLKNVDFGLKVHYLGSFQDDISLSLAYSAADVMAVPSTQEAFGQTAFEALACGVPVVAFDATGLKDIVDHQVDGYLARPFEIDDFLQGINWIIENNQRQQNLSARARQKSLGEYSSKLQASRYLSLYEELLSTYRLAVN